MLSRKPHTKSWLKASLMLTAGAATLAMAPQALAQDAGDEVIVTGIRQSLENALVEKRNADSLIEVILAEDIGKLPDQNLAEVLENVTGIQITREAGVGTGVQIRGANENRIEVNGVTTVGSGAGRGGINFEDVSAAIIAGVEVIKAPESSTIEGAVGGTINLRTIRPLDLNDTLASVRFQLEDSSLSTNGIQPRFEATVGNKWENAKGQEIGVVLSGSYTQQDTTAFRPRAEADNTQVVNNADQFNTLFLAPQFFVQDLDNFEAETINFAGTVEARPANNIKVFADLIVNRQDRFQESSRVQASGIANLDAALAIEADPNSVFETVDFGSIGGTEIGTIERAVFGTVIVQPDETDGNLRFSSDTGSRETDGEIIRVGGEWEATDALTARAEFSHSSSDTIRPNLLTTLNFINPNVGLDLATLNANAVFNIENADAIEAGTVTALPTPNENGTPFVFDLRDEQLAFGISQDPALFGPTTEQLLDPANVVFEQLNQSFDENENSETAVRLDFNYDLEDSKFGNGQFGNFLTSIDAGYRYSDTSSAFTSVEQNNSNNNIVQSPVGTLFADILVPGPNNFDDGDDRELFVSDFLVVDPELTQSDPGRVLDTINAAITANNAEFGFSQSLLSSPDADQDSSFEISEETHAIYGQANFDFGLIRGNAGVRYVDTTVVSAGFQTLNGVTTLTETEGSYDFFLPRINLIAEPIENVLIRGAYSRDIRRPDFADLSTSFTFDTSPNPAVSIGNPGLAPQEIDNFDIGAEWYFAPAAVFSVGYFRKERDGLFVNSTENPLETPTTVTLADGTVISEDVRDITAPCEGGGIFNPIADRNVFAPIDPVTGVQDAGVGVCVPIANVINDPGTTTQQGIEVAFQYDLSGWEDRIGWASGFGLLANYTYQEFSGTESVLEPSGRGEDIFEALGAFNVEFPNTLLDNSENAYNITVFYEKFGLSARARWTWRDAFRTEDTAAGASLNSTLGFPTVTDSRGQLNAGVNYDVTDHLNIGVEAVNLTNSDITQRCVNEDGPVCFTGFADRRIVFGASYTF